MTIKELTEIMTSICDYYPAFHKESQNDDEKWKRIILAWHKIFKNVEAEKLIAGVHDYAKHDPYGRPPWPGALMHQIYGDDIPERIFVKTGEDEDGFPVGRYEDF